MNGNANLPTRTVEFSRKRAREDIARYKRLFLSGAAGVGKSYLTKKIIEKNNTVVLGTTGIAAANIGGMTVHKFFNLSICKNVEELEAYTHQGIERILKQKQVPYKKARQIFYSRMKSVLENTDLIIIDEVSMMSDKLLDMVFHRLEHLNATEIPILFIGDMYQLPPINKEGDVHYVFESKYWKDVMTVELTKIKRTDDVEFAKLQHMVRVGEGTPEINDFIRALANTRVDENTTMLFSTHREVDAHNRLQFNKLDTQIYCARVKEVSRANDVTDEMVEQFINDLNLPKELNFRVGAKIIFTLNDDEEGFYNGEVGIIEEVDEDSKSVRIVSQSSFGDNSRERREYIVVRHNYDKIKYVPRKDGRRGLEIEKQLTVSAFPFKLGYAITIHKSQGMTLSEGSVDCKNIFTPEQFYVALSRFSSPKHLKIVNFNPAFHIAKNEYIDNFYANAVKLNENEFGRVLEDERGEGRVNHQQQAQIVIKEI